ncbi:MAG: rod shape-determining protein MreD [Chitinivibrionales bacterium]|nr:rod shape-determining protein MreD [Chitinivibrionales bacterium]MBD3357161.1 rod shape-determining protein MreD [Chitinivibrionales bacterium]
MRAAIWWFGVLCISLVLQSTLVPVVGIKGIQPDLLMVALFLLAMGQGVMPATYAGFFLGLAQDLYSPALLGQNALAKSITGFFAGLFNEKIMRTDPIVKIVILVLAFLIHDTVFIVTELVKTNSPLVSVAKELLTHTLPRTAYSAVVASIFYAWEHAVKPSLQR